MDYPAGASVISADGEQVGELDRVVIDPKNGSVTHLVVRKGFLLPVDKVIPVELVSSSQENEVHLKEESGRMEELPDFIETNFLPLDEQEMARHGYTGDIAHPIYWYPGVGAAPLMWGGGYWGTTSPAMGYPNIYPVEQDQNIPEGTVALKQGARVIGMDGEHVGDVAEVLTESEHDRITHLVITKGVIGKQRKLIPANWIDGIKRMASGCRST